MSKRKLREVDLEEIQEQMRSFRKKLKKFKQATTEEAKQSTTEEVMISQVASNTKTQNNAENKENVCQRTRVRK